MYVGGWLSKHTLTLDFQRMALKVPLFQFGASFVAHTADGVDDDSTIIGSVEPGGFADLAGWKEGFKVVAVNGDTPVESRTQLASIIKAQRELGATTCQLCVDPRPEEPEPVVLKLMRNKEQYDREIEQRKHLDPSKCVPVIFHSAEAPKLWEAGVTQRGSSEYKYGIVMPAAERNLLVVLVQERVTFTGIRTMLWSVARCLQHMHKAGKVHGDLKPLNVVRSYKGDFQLIDFDATVELGKPIGAKTSTAYVPPELIVEGTTLSDPFVKSHSNVANSSVDGTDEALAAHQTFDIWSFAVVAYRALARELLFKSDDSDNAPTAELDRIFKWNHSTLDQSVRKLQSFLISGGLLMGGDDIARSHSSPTPKDALMAVELLAWMLQPDPFDRPQSFDEVLDHPLFAAAAHGGAVQPSSGPPRPNVLKSFYALHDYDAATDNDLSFQKGDVLYITNDSDDNWWQGVLASNLSCQGCIPSNYVAPGLGKLDGNEGSEAAAAGNLLPSVGHVEDVGSHSSWRMSMLHVAAALGTLDGELDAGTASVSRTNLGLHINTPEPLMHRTPLHLAVGGGHVQVVEMLLDPIFEADPNLKDKIGYTALHGLLVTLEESITNPTDNQVKVAQLLFDRCDLELEDSDGRSAMKLGSSSRWKAVRSVFSRRVIKQVERLEKFSATEFMGVWGGDDVKLRSDLERQLWTTIREATTRPITIEKGTFLKEAIFPLEIWDSAPLFANLQQVAAEQEAKIVAETHHVRDAMLSSCASGEQIRTLEQITEKVQQAFPTDAMASLGNEFKTVSQRDKLEQAVIVPLLQLRAEQAVSHFANELQRVLPTAEVKGVGVADTGVGASTSSHTQDSVGADDGAEPHANPTVEIAPVKGVPRMEFKVLEYRGELRERDGAVPEATLLVSADGTRRWRPEALEQLGDCLRCTVECETGDGVWAAFEAIRDGFDLKPGNGRLKNNMDPKINNMDSDEAKPPDMLINVVLGTNDAIIYPMVAEIQVHLAAINRLKHENHILYKVRRALNASELRQSTAPPTPTPAPASTLDASSVESWYPEVQTVQQIIAMSAATKELPPLGAPLPSSASDALAAEVVELKAQMARMAEKLATQQGKAENYQREAEENAAQVQGMEELLLEQAAELDALQNSNSTNA
jgi:serine/threonine protein kinase